MLILAHLELPTLTQYGAVRFRHSWSSWVLKLSWHIMYKASRQLAYSVVKFTIFIPLLLQWLVSAVSLTAFLLAIRQAWFHQTLLKYNMQQRSLAREQVKKKIKFEKKLKKFLSTLISEFFFKIWLRFL